MNIQDSEGGQEQKGQGNAAHVDGGQKTPYCKRPTADVGDEHINFQDSEEGQDPEASTPASDASEQIPHRPWSSRV